MKTGSKSPLLPAVIKKETTEKLQTGKKVKPRAVAPSKPAAVNRLKIWKESDEESGVVLVIENMESRKRTRLAMTFEQFGEFVHGFGVVVTPTRPE
jgi:hypothetical protein